MEHAPAGAGISGVKRQTKFGLRGRPGAAGRNHTRGKNRRATRHPRDSGAAQEKRRTAKNATPRQHKASRRKNPLASRRCWSIVRFDPSKAPVRVTHTRGTPPDGEPERLTSGRRHLQLGIHVVRSFDSRALCANRGDVNVEAWRIKPCHLKTHLRTKVRVDAGAGVEAKGQWRALPR